MKVEDEFTLSNYKTIADIHPEHGICLVQHINTKSIYVKKELHVFDLDVLTRLQKHPVKGIPQIIELIPADENTLILIEEYIAGTDLEHLLREKHRLSESETTRIVLQLCDILEALHRLQPPIIHRDIKPSNLILTPEGSLFLIDFNAARMDTAHRAEDTVLLGTKGYAAPEQYGFGSSDVTTDIYALGILMNTLLTGQVSREEISGGKYRPIIKKCLQIDRNKRYASVTELKSAITGKFVTPQWMRYLPPGFRRANPLHMVLACFLYLLIYAGLTGVFDTAVAENHNPWPVTIGFSLSFVFAILFAANYLDVQKRIPGLVSKKRYQRYLIVFGISCLIWLFFFVIAVLCLAAF